MFRFLFIIIFTFSSLSFAEANDYQDVNYIVESFKTSMSDKNAHNISDLLDNSVELTYNNLHSTYSRGQAVLIFNDFYEKTTLVHLK